MMAARPTPTARDPAISNWLASTALALTTQNQALAYAKAMLAKVAKLTKLRLI